MTTGKSQANPASTPPPSRACPRVGRMGDQVVDTHVHLQLDGWPQMGVAPHPLPAYLDQSAHHDVGRFGVLAMAPRGDLERMRRMNDAVLAVGHADPRSYAMCSVHPHDGTPALAELERVRDAGARGIKLHPNSQGFDVGEPAVRGVVERAGELDLPVLFDSVAVSDPGQPEKFMVLATQCPGTQIVLAHSFGPKYASAVMFSVLGRYPSYTRNVWLELSGLVCMFAGSPFAEQIAWVMRNHGMDRVLWGSDFPLFGVGEALAALEGYGFDVYERRLVTRDNAIGLFRLEG